MFASHWLNFIVLLFLFSVFVYIFIFKFVKYVLYQNKIKTDGVLTEGTIIDFETERDSEGTWHHPVLRYTTKEGEQIVSVSDDGYMDRSQLGKCKRLYYLPANPSKFTFEKSGWFHYLLAWSLFIAALILLGRETLKAFLASI